MLREFAEQALTRLKYQPIMPVAASVPSPTSLSGSFISSTMSVLIASCISEILLRVVGIETDPNHLPVEFWISLSAALSEMLFSRFTFPKLCHYFVVPVWLLLGVSTALIFYMGPISVLATSYRWTLSLFGVGLILLGFTLVQTRRAEKEKWNDESCIALLDSSFLVAALTEGEDDEKA
ncbi:hypothetical protein BC829DRAFT_493911 [Chytridium lagenaria]|nr:hypothetical protein BC829DRAFT_493911 [Chytridium lagenaria]